MRVPDLDWPSDLFEDSTAARYDHGSEAEPSAKAADRHLWPSMLTRWLVWPPVRSLGTEVLA